MSIYKTDLNDKFNIGHILTLSYSVDDFIRSDGYGENAGRKILKVDEFNSTLSSIIDMNNKIITLCKRIEKGKNITIDIEGFIDKLPTEKNNINITLRIVEPLENNEIKNIYNDWLDSSFVKDLNINFEHLKMLYQKEGIKDPPIEIEPEADEESGIITIGFFTEDECILVGMYNPTTRKFVIDDEEFYRSIEDYYSPFSGNQQELE